MRGAVAGMSGSYRYVYGERLSAEVLVFEVGLTSRSSSPSTTTCTLGEAHTDGFDRIPFLSNEVWLDDAHPGRIIITFVGQSIESGKQVGDERLQQTLQARFDDRFPHPVTLVRALHEESNYGIHRVSRFERSNPA